MTKRKASNARAVSECMKLRTLLSDRFKDATFRVVIHDNKELPRNENIILARKRLKNSHRVSINYSSAQVSLEELLQYLQECGYGNFALSFSYDGLQDTGAFNTRVVAYVHEGCSTLAAFA